MKGGKDDDKNMSPMFPRLHVSDTEKGGPRAPPRNKMALYEQLSIPSQRFNSGPTSTVPTGRNSTAPLVPVASLSQGIGHERTTFLPLHISSTTADSDDNINSHTFGGASLRTKGHKIESHSMKNNNHGTSNTPVHMPSTAEYGSFPVSNRKNSCPDNLGNDSDFSVPTCVDSGITPSSNKDQHNDERERLTPLSPMRSSRSTETSGNSAQKAASAACNASTHLHSARDKHLKRTNTTDLWSRQHVRNSSEDYSIEYVMSKDYAERTASHQFHGEKVTEPSKHSYASPDQGLWSGPFDNLGGMHNKDRIGHMQPAYAENNGHSGFILPEVVAMVGKGNVLQATNTFPSSAPRNDRGSCNEYREDEIHESLQATDMDRNDDASETSMVDSISGFDISPDDVVGVIGQRHFWKARRAIVNQQRLFQVQVFELHRLIKVQKLIAGSPHLLLEDTAFIAKPPVKVVAAKKQSDFLLKSSPQIMKQSIESWKPTKNTVRATENAVAKPSLTSLSGEVNIEQANQPTSHGPHHENPMQSPASDGNKPNWSYHPPPGNQWLVPVMSASEGLVYKPYSGPCPPRGGFMTPMYGGCGPMSSPSMGGEYPNPYGVPASHHQGIGGYPNAPPYPQPYFPPYGMSMMNQAMSASSVEHANPSAGSQSRGQTERMSTGEVNLKMHSRASRNISNQKSEAISSGLPKFQPHKESEIQGSTASSPGEKRAPNEGAGNGNGNGNGGLEGRDALPLFPMAPVVQDPDLPSEAQNTRVIKVVPHNPRSATESAARIFQSIQDERQQYDPV